MGKTLKKSSFTLKRNKMKMKLTSLSSRNISNLSNNKSGIKTLTLSIANKCLSSNKTPLTFLRLLNNNR